MRTKTTIWKYVPANRLVRLVWVVLFVFPLVAWVGCEESISRKALPAPLVEEESYVLTEGSVRRLWGGDNFEFGHLYQLHYIVLRGVDTPKPGQPFFALARNYANRMMRKKSLRVEVVGRDELKREISNVFVVNEDPADLADDANVAVELLRNGYGWYDGEKFEGWEVYQEAEQWARDKKLGLWEDANPVAPWNYAEGKQNELREALGVDGNE